MPALAEAMLRSLLLGIAVALALALLRVRSPHLQKCAWTVVLVSALIMPVLMRTHGPVIRAPGYVLSVTLSAVGATVSSPARPSVGAIYGVVAILLLTRYALSLTRLMCIRRKARRVVEGWADSLDVRVTAELSGPATFGATILLPEEHVRWSVRKREAILAHERSHVLARDCQRLWLAQLHKCLFWLNPLAWWLERRIAALAEETSDAAALRVLGDAPAYAEMLLEFAAAGGGTSTVVAGMSSPRIGARIERIIGGKVRADEPRMWRRIAVAAGSLPVILLCATLQVAPGHWAFAQERATAGEGPGVRGAPADEPGILSWPTARQLTRFYPPQARRAGIDGSVTLAVVLNDAGHATDTQVVAEEPLDFGFGAAAAAVAHAMKYSNPTGHAAQLEFRMKFALHHAYPLAKSPR
jgi:TonB family protein